eukprot:4048486-Pleurochrysis_carterae.AAC.1
MIGIPFRPCESPSGRAVPSKGVSNAMYQSPLPNRQKNISLQCVADSGAAFTAMRYDELQMLGETQIHPTRL